MIELGQAVKDRISGMEGIALGRSVFLYCSPRIQVGFAKLDGVKPMEPVWFDEGQLEGIEASHRQYNLVRPEIKPSRDIPKEWRD